MRKMVVDTGKCVKCGVCAEVCPVKIISMDAKKGPVPAMEGAEELCINCGHCVAVCPHGAMSLDTMPAGRCAKLEDNLKCGFKEAAQFLEGRRSIREFRDKPVPKEEIEKIIDVARFAPSGHNRQPVNWKVIYEKEKVKELSASVIEWMEHILQRKPEMAKSMNFEMLIDRYKKGEDVVLRGAPHVITTHAPKEDRIAPGACMISLTYLELIASASGLGACWAGFLDMALMYWPPLKKSMDLPEGHVTFGSMMLGYPRYKYYRIPLRDPAKITWR